jgi:hypothetical protein
MSVTSSPSPQIAAKPSSDAIAPPVPLVGAIRLLPRGFASSVLVLTDIPPLLTAYAIGQLFAVYGKLRVNVVLSQTTRLTAVLQFAEGGCGHFAHSALNGSILELDTDMQMECGEHKEAKEDCFIAQRYMFDIRFAEEPLLISSFTPASADLKLQAKE